MQTVEAVDRLLGEYSRFKCIASQVVQRVVNPIELAIALSSLIWKHKGGRWSRQTTYASHASGDVTRRENAAQSANAELMGRQKHHQLLHENSAQGVTTETNAIGANAECLYKYIPVTITGLKGRRAVLAFLKEGSKASLIEEELAENWD